MEKQFETRDVFVREISNQTISICAQGDKVIFTYWSTFDSQESISESGVFKAEDYRKAILNFASTGWGFVQGENCGLRIVQRVVRTDFDFRCSELDITVSVSPPVEAEELEL